MSTERKLLYLLIHTSSPSDSPTSCLQPYSGTESIMRIATSNEMRKLNFHVHLTRTALDLIGLFSVQNCAMAPLDSADGALRSMCRVVAKLLHPEQNSEESDLHHLQMCEKILHEQPEQKPIATKPPDEPGAKVNCEMHTSALRTGPTTARDLKPRLTHDS